MLQVRSDQVPVPLPLCSQRTPLCVPPLTQPHPHWPCSLYLHSQSLCFLTLSALRGWSQAESIISSFYIWINRGSKGLSICQGNMFNRHKDPGLLPPGPHQKACVRRRHLTQMPWSQIHVQSICALPKALRSWETGEYLTGKVTPVFSAVCIGWH